MNESARSQPGFDECSLTSADAQPSVLERARTILSEVYWNPVREATGDDFEHLEDALAVADDMRDALQTAKARFEEYALLHYRKRTAESDEKAFSNQRMADICGFALKAESRS